MAKSVSPVQNRFNTAVDAALSLVASTEGLWLTAPPASLVRRQLTVRQLEALYESVFLRIFGLWEGFLQDLTLHWMARYRSPGYAPVAPGGGRLFPSIQVASLTLHFEDGRARDYLLWHHPPTVKRRVRRVLVDCPVETLCDTELDTLTRYAAVRHHIAHGSADSRRKFILAATALTGSDYGGRAGRLLRAADIADPLNQPKWIRVFSEQLKAFAATVVA
jgi:hypothetical protein